MIKRLLLTFSAIFLMAINANAVLKEKDLGHTLHVLRLELYNKWMKQRENIKLLEDNRERQHAQLINLMQRAETTSLILYSQGDEFTLDMTFACQQATVLYHELRRERMPFDKIKTFMTNEIARYDSLITSLQQIPPAIGHSEDNELLKKELKEHEHHKHEKPYELDENGIQDRAVCIKYAQTLKENLINVLSKLEDDNEHYQILKDKVEKMNEYAEKKYTALQQSIFINPGTNYFRILGSLPMQWNRMKGDFNSKYLPLKETHKDGSVHYFRSEWRGGVVLFASIFMLVYILGAALLSNVILRLCIPKRFRTETFNQKRPILIMALAIMLFAIAVTIVRNFMQHNLMIMAAGLMIEIAWLIEAIYISLIIRLKGKQIVSGAKIYSPFMLMSIVVICFRIVLIPNKLVNIIFPAILLVFTIWQMRMLKKHKKEVPSSDRLYCYISLIAMVIACFMSWIGYTLMAVQLMIWWMFQLAAIATITCCYDLMEMYENRVIERRIKKDLKYNCSDSEIIRKMKRGYFVEQTWLYDFMNRAVVPVCSVLSILFSVFMAAEIFDLRNLCFKWFMWKVNIPGVMTVSIFELCLIASLFFIFKYVNYLIRSIWFDYSRERNSNFNATLARNIIGLFTWGVYAIIVFLILDVPSDGIKYLGTGLAGGIGFASKSLLENFIYGISLMSGRVRVGDYIECDGITGKVESITYQSTQLITLDGSVVAILNSELFGKNFKNLTRNHQYELIKIPFGVAYGTNVEDVRKMIVDGLQSLCTKTEDGRDVVNPANKISVAFSDFGASSVDLFLIAWVLVDQKIKFTGQAKEKIYQVLNENNVEIPFPQQDIYIRSIAKTE